MWLLELKGGIVRLWGSLFPASPWYFYPLSLDGLQVLWEKIHTTFQSLRNGCTAGSASEKLATVSSRNWDRPSNHKGHLPRMPPFTDKNAQIGHVERICFQFDSCQPYPLCFLPTPITFPLSPSSMSACGHVSDTWLILQGRRGGGRKRWIDKSSLYSFPGK